MRPITRNVVIAIVVVVAGLLALGAVPSYLRSGAPYYVVAEPTDPGPSVNATDLSERRYPYLTGAVSAAERNGSDGEVHVAGSENVDHVAWHAPAFADAAVAATFQNEESAAVGTLRRQAFGRLYRDELHA